MGVRIDGSNDVVSAVDGTLTVDGLSLNVAGIITASGGFKVGSAVTISSNGNATFSGITTFGDSVHTGIGVSVGIGTDIPEHALVVRDTGLARLRIRNDTASSENYASLNLKTAGFDNGWSVYSEFKSSDADNYLKIFKGDGTATHMYFQDPNEVGIRSAFYHVDANGADQGDSCFGFIANTANPGFKVKSGGTERFRVTSGGLVGVNVIPTQQKLTIDLDNSGTTAASFDGINICNTDSTTNNGAAIVFGQAIAGNSYARIGVIHSDRSGGSEDQDIFFGTLGGGSYAERVRIASTGQFRIGSFGAPSNKNTVTPLAHVDGSGVNGGLQVNRHTSVGGGGAQLILSGTRGASITGHTVLQNDDGIGTVVFAGSDGGEFVTGAEIQAVVDADPGDDDMPGRIVFKTTADGASGPTERLRISRTGHVSIGTTSNAYTDALFQVNTSLGNNYFTTNAHLLLQNKNDSTTTYWNVAPRDDGNLTFGNGTPGSSGVVVDRFVTIEKSSGSLVVGKTASGVANNGGELRDGDSDYALVGTSNAHTVMILNRNTSDGNLVIFRQANSQEGTISVSGSTVTYGQFCGSHWGRLEDNSKSEILPGTILETINKAVEWKVIEFTVDGVQKRQAYNGSAENGDSVTVEYEGVSYTGTVADEVPDSDALNKHVCVKVSDTAASKAVFGVFLGWDTDEEEGIIGVWNDMNIAALGNYFIRIKSGQSLEIGDLIESDGTGCGVVQSDDIIRSKTVAKVTSTTPQKVYTDGSFLVTCVLYSG
jgi:hypothetical protein